MIRALADRAETSPPLHRRRDLGWILQSLRADANAAGLISLIVSVDATIIRAHQHAANTIRPEQHTGGTVELQESSLFR